MRGPALALLLVLAWGCGGEEPAPEPPETAPGPVTVVSLAPSLTELVYDAGLESHLIGVTTYCKHPEAAAALPKIGGYGSFNVEEMIKLRPSGVLVLGNSVGYAKVTSQLEPLGIGVCTLDNSTTAQIASSYEALGEFLGAPDAGKRARARFEAALAAARGTPPTGTPPAVLVIVGYKPGEFSSMTAAGPGSIYHEVVALAGGRNVMAEAGKPYPRISPEGAIRAAPDLILEIHPPALVTAERRAAIEARWRQALPRARVKALDDDGLLIPGPRVVGILRVFAREIQHGQ